MNEKIKQLALDAGIHFEEGKESRIHFVSTATLDQFAELIIQESIHACGEDYGAQLVYQHWYKENH